ncbi:MAG: hypothetical protein ACYTGV_04385 [Planctomycetota bacterium]
MIIVHRTKEQARKLHAAAADARYHYRIDPLGGRLFAVPLGEEDRTKEASFASELEMLFYLLRYGWIKPTWTYVGEGRVPWHETLVGRPFRELPALEQSDFGAFADQSFCYVAHFRYGAKRYRKAYRAFLKDYGETGDWENSAGEHLLALDQVKLQEDAQEFIRTGSKEVRPR